MATVLEMKRELIWTEGVENKVVDNEIDVVVKVRIDREGAGPIEAQSRMRFPQLSVPGEGSQIPIIYDPEDPDTMMYDDTVGAIGTMLGDPGLSDLANMALSGADEASIIEAAQQMFPGATTIPGGQPGGASPTGAPAPIPATDVEQLERLASLHESGDLTDEEYAAAKARILGS